MMRHAMKFQIVHKSNLPFVQKCTISGTLRMMVNFYRHSRATERFGFQKCCTYALVKKSQFYNLLQVRAVQNCKISRTPPDLKALDSNEHDGDHT